MVAEPLYILGQLVPRQHRNLNGGVVVRARYRTLREIVMRRVRGHISAEIRRNRGDGRRKVGILLLGNAGCHHLADVVAEVRAVVEEARLTADRRGRKIPVIGHFGKRFVEIRDILVVKVLVIVGVHRAVSTMRLTPFSSQTLRIAATDCMQASVLCRCSGSWLG